MDDLRTSQRQFVEMALALVRPARQPWQEPSLLLLSIATFGR